MFGYFGLYLLLFITIKHMKTALKIVNNIFIKWKYISFKGQLIKTIYRWYLEINSLCQNTHFTYKIIQYTCFNWTCYTCSYVKGYEVCFNTTNSNFQLQNFRYWYWLCTSILDCFGQLESLLCMNNSVIKIVKYFNESTGYINEQIDN